MMTMMLMMVVYLILQEGRKRSTAQCTEAHIWSDLLICGSPRPGKLPRLSLSHEYVPVSPHTKYRIKPRLADHGDCIGHRTVLRD